MGCRKLTCLIVRGKRNQRVTRACPEVMFYTFRSHDLQLEKDDKTKAVGHTRDL